MGTDGALSPSPGDPNMGFLVSKLRGEAEGNLKAEGVDWRRRAARSPRLLAPPPGECCLGPLDTTSVPGGRQLRRVKAKAGACTHPLRHSLPLPKVCTKGEGPERLLERNQAFFLCFFHRLLFSRWAAQAGSTHAISSTTPPASNTRGRS